jgi:hypothetical protein
MKRSALEVYVNIRKSGKRTLLALCDAEMLGKTLKQGKLRFHIDEKFYKGSLMSLEDAVTLIQQSTIVNMIGYAVVKKAIDRGLIHPDAVLRIDGVPHAQIVKF